MIRALLIAAHLLEPDCQRLCLGVCHYDWQAGRCDDSRVHYLGTWDVVPTSYVPPKERDFPGWVIPYPAEWGTYSLECK